VTPFDADDQRLVFRRQAGDPWQGFLFVMAHLIIVCGLLLLFFTGEALPVIFPVFYDRPPGLITMSKVCKRCR